jgi:DNA helicase HerA-like ATPase
MNDRDEPPGLNVSEDEHSVGDDGVVEVDSPAEIDVTPVQDGKNSVEDAAAAAIRSSLVTLGFAAFDSASTDNATSGVMVPADRRSNFRRDVYVGIRDDEQNCEFLGRVVEGPFHSPHDVSADSAITRTTILHPERTRFRASYYVHGSIEVLGEIRDGERVIPTPTRPRPYSEVYIFPSDRLHKMLGLEGNFFIGHLMGYEQVRVQADIDSKNFLPRNLGIFGTVGSGKSNTVQVLMEEAIKAGWAVVAIDVEGEYVRMNEPTVDPDLAQSLAVDFGLGPAGVPDLKTYVPSAGTSEAASPIEFKVPISAIRPEIIADVLEFSEPQTRMFGGITAAAARQGRSSTNAAVRRQGVLASSTGSTVPNRDYTLQVLIDGLDDQSQPPYALIGGNVPSAERNTAHALRSKLIGLGRSGMLDWNGTSNVAELPILDLLVPGRLSVLDVSETDDRSRNIAISYLLQALFEEALGTDKDQPMANGLARPPILVVIEEVHTFVSKAAAQRMRGVIDQLQLVTRRGRKRWMGLALVSQQPGHVPDELFELANTRFIHQLKSTTNLTPVRQTTGGVHEALWTTVPALAPGQALMSGAVFRNPLFVTVRPAQSRRLLTT